MKLSLKILSLLSCVALLSVGFAAWWIVTINNQDPTTTGSFTTYTVGQKNVDVVVNDITPEKIVYGKPASTSTPATWLVIDDMANEVMEATMTFTVSTAAGTNLSSLIGGVQIEFASSDADTFEEGIDNGYIAAPVITGTYGNGTSFSIPAYNATTGKVSVTLPDAALNSNTVTVTLTFTFDWGTKTGGQNPFDYYNKQSYDKATEASALLEWVNNNMASANYNVTITATPKTAN